MRVHANELHQHDVAGEGTLELCVLHRVAAVLDDDGGAVEALDVGQCLGEHQRGAVVRRMGDGFTHGAVSLARS